jgi:hypothetical protein
MIRTGLFKYVLHENIEKHHRAGWMVVRSLGASHGFYSVLMWRCDCGGAE